MNPFPLSDADRAQFLYDVKIPMDLPSWGAIVQWNNRYVLVYQKPDYSLALTDITSGIPWSGAPGGVVPVQSLIATATKQDQLPGPVTAFLYSLGPNFLAVAGEDAQVVATAAEDAVHAVTPDLTLLAVIAIAALVFIYTPRPRG